MPNTFAPRAFESVVKDNTEKLRMAHDGDRGDVKEWHGIIFMLDDEATRAFARQYDKVADIPDVVGVEVESEAE